ncbi:MAG TPA: pitrilysin family protein [Thermoanaerobaculia bacterium]|nr:pitrilysin family protein [Thermoanaerobaculia bacterium]
MTHRKLITLAVALLTTTALYAQKQTPPAPGTPRNFAIPTIQRMELPNGLRVRLVPYGEVPKVTVRLVLQTGNVDEAANQVWLADLTADMMQQGTATRSAEQIAKEAAMMGGSLDVGVGENQTTIGTDVFSESATNAIALIADVARHPRFPEAELARLKADRARTLSIQRSQPGSLAAERYASALFPNTPYGQYFPTETMLQGYTLDQVRTFYDRNYGAARATIYVVGRFDTAAVQSAIRANFADWKSGAAPTKLNVTPVNKRAVYFIDRPGAVQSTLNIGLPVIDAAQTDYLPLTVMNAILGGSFGSRITSNIREQKGYTYSPSGSIATRPSGATWTEIADVTTKDTGASIKEILYEIDRLRNEPPTDAELKGIQNYLAGTYVLRNSSRAGIAAQLAFLDLYGLSEDYLRNYVQRVYALTPADIQRMAKTYIDPSKLAIVVVGDKSIVMDQIKTYGDVMP